MMWTLFIQLSISQLKELLTKSVFKKFIELFKCRNYAYYLTIMILLNMLFIPYYIKIVLETIIIMTEIIFILLYKIFVILTLNYLLLYFFYEFQKELEIAKLDSNKYGHNDILEESASEEDF